MGSRLLGGFAACALILAVAGCDLGSSSGATNSPSSAPAATAACPGTASPGSGTAITLTAADFCFSPSTLNLAAGQEVKIQFVNGGTKEHDLTIGDKDVGEADASKTTSLTYTATAAGSLQFFCKYHKTSNNMVGTANVTGAAGASSAPSAGASTPAAPVPATRKPYGY